MVTGDMGDLIELSPREVTVAAEGGTIVCTTTGVGWDVCTIVIDDEIYSSTREERHKCALEGVFDKTVEWLTVSRQGSELHVTVAPNDTGKERTFKITLVYCDSINLMYGTQEK